MTAGSEIGLRIDQTLTQDATGSTRSSPPAELTVRDRSTDTDFTVRHRLSPRQVAMVLAGGQIPLVRGRPENQTP